jgi:predicted ATPase with chaperone activity
VKQVQRQSVRQMQVRPYDIARAFRNLVLDPQVLTQLGTAVTSGRAIFLWGPTGTGKTSIAETLMEIFETDHVYLPYAVEVDGQFITIYDPHVHQRVVGAARMHDSDQRWVLCHRPRVKVGGELTIEMLDLEYNQATKFYTGPVQMKANNGLLIIDDFGRQRVRPDELLNRWVVPLDRHVDYLTLAGGKKIEMPFDMFVVFATNMDPARLVDEAFLRRIQTKIKVDVIRREQFHKIFFNVCKEMKVLYDAAVADFVADYITQEAKQPLRACYPRDVVNQVCWAARYEGREPSLTKESVLQACHNYFINEEAA